MPESLRTWILNLWKSDILTPPCCEEAQASHEVVPDVCQMCGRGSFQMIQPHAHLPVTIWRIPSEKHLAAPVTPKLWEVITNSRPPNFAVDFLCKIFYNWNSKCFTISGKKKSLGGGIKYPYLEIMNMSNNIWRNNEGLGFSYLNWFG